jgi:hypothetical protein
MTDIIAPIPSPDHGVEDAIIVMTGSKVVIEVSYDHGGNIVFGRIEFRGVLGVNIASEPVAVPASGSYDKVIRSETTPWSQGLLDNLNAAFYRGTPNLYRLYLSNYGSIDILAEDVQAEMNLPSSRLLEISDAS